MHLTKLLKTLLFIFFLPSLTACTTLFTSTLYTEKNIANYYESLHTSEGSTRLGIKDYQNNYYFFASSQELKNAFLWDRHKDKLMINIRLNKGWISKKVTGTYRITVPEITSFSKINIDEKMWEELIQLGFTEYESKYSDMPPRRVLKLEGVLEGRILNKNKAANEPLFFKSRIVAVK